MYGALVRLSRALAPGTAHPPRDQQPVRRVLIMQPYGVGDMILTTPLITFLKEQLPGAEIDVLASARNRAVIAGDERVARVFVRERSWRKWVATLARLRSRRYDLVVSGQAGRHLAEGLAAVAASQPETRRVSIWRPKRYHGLFTRVVRIPPTVTHTADRLLYLGHEAIGLPPTPPLGAGSAYPLRIVLDQAAERRADNFLRDRGVEPGFVVVNLSANFADRDWLPPHCAACLGLILARHPSLPIVVTPAPGREETAHRVAALARHPRIVVAPVLPLLDLVGVVRRARIVMSPNTALIHMASACGTPVVGLYTSQPGAEASRWLPLGVPYRALSALPGATLDQLPPADVAAAFDELLSSRDVLAASAR